ncbi:MULTISPECIES: hypothetical protein [unclassified Enterobacter]|jgi:hypothetical protein|uniref:hypothetical protein n=1 Tax=unclassified Enterobacter TaxID=2608935 RepID=UPI0015C762D8|nr:MULTISPECIES: hypothetical protein [unclassified Enterobacter]MBB3306707.1 hypothetical protein [Enterobacter sp. Sphag1F]NYI15968.1 hypothetical protein [Enterobacter sp. Sphag71]
MKHLIQHALATSGESTTNMEKDDSRVSFQLTEQTSLDSLDTNEAKERHGAQYHLRHHLSGCAQTLHIVDFTNDFSLPVLQEPIIIPQIHAEPTASASDIPVTEFNAQAIDPLPSSSTTIDAPSSVATAAFKSEIEPSRHVELKALFASHADQAGMPMIPLDVASLEQDIGLDDFIDEPATPTQARQEISFELAAMPPEAMFGLSQISAISYETEQPLGSSLNVAMVLNSAEPELFAASSTIQSEPAMEFDMETLADATQPQMWNHFSEDFIEFAPTVLTEISPIMSTDRIEMDNMLN